MNAIGTTENPLRVAIVGSGPSGFYAAGHLLKSKSHPELVAQVDLYDRLPTPWGLVRGGVAPDHPNIKAVSRVYEKTAQHPEFRFHGNVELGRDIGATGAPRPLSRSGLRDGRRRPTGGWASPGEDLPAAGRPPSSWPGTTAIRTIATSSSTSPCERAVVIGNGNVAADVARMLALTREELADHRRGRPRARGARRERRQGDRGARASRSGAGGVHQPGAAGARRDDRRGRVRGRRATWSSTRSAGRSSRARTRTSPRARTWRS